MRLLIVGLLVIAGAMLSLAHGSEAAVRDVKVFGAKGDAKTDDTAAFQRALDDAASSGGGTVLVPVGQYLFAGHLNVPNGVTLEGVWKSVPAHNGMRDAGLPKPTDDGTTFLVTENKGNEEGAPFITLQTNATLKGVVIYYPNQKTDDAPKAYPWAIALRGKNPAVIDVELLNPYKGIDASKNERHLIRNVQGQPLKIGVFVDEIYDIGRIENVHFNPWWSMKPKLFEWQMANGIAFVFGRTDWQYVLNTFCFGYNIGYRFVKTSAGVCNGNFLGIGADDCFTALQVDECAPMGLLITNGEFVAFHGPDPTMVRVASSHTGSVRFVNSSFWGPCRQIAVISGSGTVGFSDCTFVQWDARNEDRYAIQADGGNLFVRGCEFRMSKPQVQLGKNVKRAVISDNIIWGRAKILNVSEGSIRIHDNAGDKANP